MAEYDERARFVVKRFSGKGKVHHHRYRSSLCHPCPQPFREDRCGRAGCGAELRRGAGERHG